MTKILCADIDCERTAVRTRNNQRYCLYHPDQPAPDMDPHTGKLRNPEKATPLRQAKKKTPPAPYRAPGRVIERPATPAAADPPAAAPVVPLQATAAQADERQTPTPPEQVEKHLPIGDPCAACDRPADQHAARPPHPAPPVVAAPATTSQDDLDALLAWADTHPARDIRDHSARLRTTLSLLRTAHRTEQEEAARRQREHDEAVAEIARLEQQLEQAKSKLLPAPAPVAVSPRPCTSCHGPVTRAHGRTGAWPRTCEQCKTKAKSA